SAGGTRLAPAGSALRPPVSAPPRRPWSHRPVQARSPVQGRDRRPVDESEVDGGWARATGGAGRVQDGTGGGAAGRPVLIGIGSATQDTGPVDASEKIGRASCRATEKIPDAYGIVNVRNRGY